MAELPTHATNMRPGWNQESMRDATFELAHSTNRVLDILASLMLEAYLYSTVEATMKAVRRRSDLSNIPSELEGRWARDAQWVLVSLAGAEPSSEVVADLDKVIVDRRDFVQTFASLEDAFFFLNDTSREIKTSSNRLMESGLRPADLAANMYGLNRIVRLATVGCYLPRVGRFTLIDASA